MSKRADKYSKSELRELIERLTRGDESVADELVEFTCAESFGLGHGRARAKICRSLRIHLPNATARSKLVDSIIGRLQSGNFSQQFRDQLKMAIRFAPERMRDAAAALVNSDKEYIRRYAAFTVYSAVSAMSRA